MFVPVREVGGQSYLPKVPNPELAEDAETGSISDLCGNSASSAFCTLGRRDRPYIRRKTLKASAHTASIRSWGP